MLQDGGEVITLNIVVGDLLFLGENDQVMAIENWKTGVDRYLAYRKTAKIQPKDITAFN